MVRNYQRKSEKRVKRALDYMKTHSERETATLFGLTRYVLQSWNKRNRDDIPTLFSQGSFKRVFNDSQENVILQFVFELAEKFYAMTRKSHGQLPYTLAEDNQLEHRFKDRTAGYDWVVSFRMRHKDKLSERTGTPLSLIRIQSFTKRNAYRFFDILEDAIARNVYSADTIFNLDETVLAVVPDRRRKCLARRGAHLFNIVYQDRGQLVTITCAANAAGRFILPMFVLPKASRYVDQASTPANSIFFKTAKGWSTSEAYPAYPKHFRIHGASSSQTSVLLILDGHRSHISYKAN